jgi:replicative DNA helicase
MATAEELGSRGSRIPPQNTDAEVSVLGSAILSGPAFDKVIELRLRPEDFYVPAHRIVFEAMLALSNRSEPIDEITICDELRRMGKLDATGGPAFVAALADRVPAPANIEYYARVIHDKFIARQLITISGEIATLAMSEKETSDELLDEAEHKLFDIAQKERKEGFTPLMEIIKKNFETITLLYQRKESVSGVPSGFNDLDKITGGFQPGNLIVVAGRPGMGKTAFALNIAQNASLTDKRAIAIFSLEMSKEELSMRMLCAQARINQQRIRAGVISNQEWKDLANAAGVLGDAPVFIYDSGDVDLIQLRMQARRFKQKHDIAVVIVDYLQLMKGPRTDNREQEIAAISRGLKAMAKELSLSVIAVSQLNRGVEARTDKTPMLSDLRESGAIEQDADLILFVHRPEYYDKNDEGKKGKAQVIIGKNRNGPVDTIELTFIKEFTRFENLAQEYT